jgi:uncharacterized protein
VEFEWDPAKSERTLAERGFNFAFASLMFEGFIVEWPDLRRDYGEVRMQAVGEVEGEILLVVYTFRGETRRIISARRANAKERKRWHSSVRP